MCIRDSLPQYRSFPGRGPLLPHPGLPGHLVPALAGKALQHPRLRQPLVSFFLRGGAPPPDARGGPLPSNSPPFPQRVLLTDRSDAQAGRLPKRRQRRCPCMRTAPFFVWRSRLCFRPWPKGSLIFRSYRRSSHDLRAFSRIFDGILPALQEMYSKQLYRSILLAMIFRALETRVWEAVTVYP